MGSSTVMERQPISPPLTAIQEFHPAPSHRKPSGYTSMSAAPRGIKRRSSDDTLISTAAPKFNKRPKILRSSSQPAAVRKMAARPRDSTTPDFDEDGLPVRYTPTTGRISKAKKGLPVHYCQYGCGKVYTRAEHRKRHEANHRKDAMFKCTVPDCQKEFQRIDLFQRHLEKQHRQGAGLGDYTRASSVASSAGSSSDPSIAEQMAMPNISTQMGMEIATPPFSSGFPSYGMEQMQAHTPWSGASQVSGLPSASSEAFSEIYSPSFRQHAQQLSGLQAIRMRTMSAPPTGTQSEFGNAFPATPNSGVWPPQYWSQQPSLPSTSFEDQYGSVDESGGATGGGAGLEHGTGAAFHGSGVPAVSASELVELDAEHLQHYHECYWMHLDKLFPVIHRPSYSPASADELLGAMILAIGAQFSSRPHAAGHSDGSYGIACSIIKQVDPESGLRSTPLARLQGLFLWEYFSLYRKQASGVHKSKRFSALYQYLLDCDVQTRPEENAVSSPGGAAADATEHEAWLHRETMRRLLISCFILDTHRSTLFHQPSIRALPPGAIVPMPCAAGLWDAPDSRTWQSLATEVPDSQPSITTFRGLLDQALNLHLRGTISADNLNQSPASLTAQALQLASQAPIKALLTVANESVLFHQQVSQDEWSAAKAQVRRWTSSSSSPIDILYASRILRSYFAAAATAAAAAAASQNLAHDISSSNLGLTEKLGGVGLEVEWCIYIATVALWAFATSASPRSGPLAVTTTATSPAMPPPSFPVASSPALSPDMGSVGMTPLTPRHVRFLPGDALVQSPQAAAPPPLPPSSSSPPLPSSPVLAQQGSRDARHDAAGATMASLHDAMHMLDAPDADQLAARLRGARPRGLLLPLLAAVRAALLPHTTPAAATAAASPVAPRNLAKGALLAEAEAVLASLIDVELGRRGAGLLAF